MVAKLNKFVILFILISNINIGFAQKDFQGKATYISKTDIDTSKFESQNRSEEEKKRIKERMTKMFEKTHTLIFNQTESIFKIKEKLEAPNGNGERRGGGFGNILSGAMDGDRYKNIQDQLMLKDAELLGKKFLITDSLPKIAWVMTGETKTIGKYTCFKATANRTIKSLEMPGPPPRGESENKKEQKTESLLKEKEVQVTAWYTMQIPVSQGPEDYWGLPGLILEVNAGKTTILCSKIVLNPEDKIEIKKPSKGKVVSEEEYTEISNKKFIEMRSQFRRGGRERNGGGNGGNRR